MAGKDLLSRLADAGEEAIARLAKAPGGEQIVGAMNAMRERMDELQKRISGLEDTEKRLDELEKRVAALEGAKRSSTRRVASATSRSASRGRTTRSSSGPGSGSGSGSKSRSSGGSAAPTGGDSPG
jgi:hypothetical protein